MYLFVYGIETKNYEKTREIVEKQLEDIKNGNFTNEEFENAKTAIIATIDFIPDEQDTQLSYYFGQEFTNEFVTIDEYKQKIQNITKEQVIEIAKKIHVDTIFFLTNNGKEEE
jgi:predicted Zn-dependent peptidase